jgi:hypothetical protein
MSKAMQKTMARLGCRRRGQALAASASSSAAITSPRPDPLVRLDHAPYINSGRTM